VTKKIRRAQIDGQGTPSAAPTRFTVGQRVRVRPGVTDRECDDLPLTGWTGTVREIDPPAYLIEWDSRTLEQIDPAYRSRAERDDFDVAGLWLDDAALEVDGEPSLQLVPRPLRPDDPEDRIRAVFGLTSEDPLPAADQDHLDRYHDYLSARLTFPFPAVFVMDGDTSEGQEHPVTAVGLLGRDDADEENGLLCRAELQGRPIAVPLSDLEVDENAPNHQLIEDYSYWFGNAPLEDFGDEAPAQPALVSGWVRLRIVAWLVFVGALLGAVLGALFMAVWGTLYGAVVGAGIGGLLGCLSGMKIASVTGAGRLFPFRSVVGVAIGIVLGGTIGGIVGALIMAAVGTFPGALAGGVLGRILGRGPATTGKCILLGMAVGAVALAFYRDQAAATVGTLHGAWIGAAAVAVLLLLVIGVLMLAGRGRR
jgi:hypothetical protein